MKKASQPEGQIKLHYNVTILQNTCPHGFNNNKVDNFKGSTGVIPTYNEGQSDFASLFAHVVNLITSNTYFSPDTK